MILLILGSIGIILGFMGFVINLYILLILVLHKKTRSSTEWIILHLSSCGFGTSICILCLVAPSIISPNWAEFTIHIHDFIGSIIMILQLLTVWSICALSFDRCSAIISPLRYTQLITRKRISFYFVFVWIISLITIILVLSLSLLHKYSEDFQNLSKPSPLLNGMEQPSNNIKYLIANESTTTENEILSTIEASLPPEAMDLTFLAISDQNSDKLSSDYEANFMENEQPKFYSENDEHFIKFEYRQPMGFSLPKITEFNWITSSWLIEWISLLIICPTIVLLICDLIVLSIARRQRHRIVMALYQITLSAQATVTGSKGTPPPPPNYWLSSNRSVPPKSRACRAVWEDIGGLIIINFPFILITVFNLFPPNYTPPPDFLYQICAISLFLGPTFNALLYGIRARPLRNAFKSYIRKRLTNTTLQQEIQQRLSPVSGSPRTSWRSSRFKSFRSYNNSPNSSGSITPRRLSLSTNDLRPPPFSHHFTRIKTSPSHGLIGTNNNTTTTNLTSNNKISIKRQVTVLRTGSRKVRSFLQLPTSIPVEFQELWSGLRKPQRSPTIVITHEIRLKETKSKLAGSNNSINSLFSNSNSSSSTPSPPNLSNHNVEHML